MWKLGLLIICINFRGKKLNLYNNSLELVNSLPKSVFLPVRTSLKVLDIRMNLKNENLDLLNYPVSVGKLYNLVELRMDCLRGKPLPGEYRYMVHLEKLVFMDGRTNIVTLQNNVFDSVSMSKISEINLAGLNIQTIGLQTFSKLKALKTLDLSNNLRLVNHVGDIAASLRNTSVKALRLNNTGLSTSPSVTTVLKQFCHIDLTELTLDGNYIHIIEPVFRDCFPNLEVLSLGYIFIFLYTSLMDDILSLKKLIGFDISHQGKYLDSDVPTKSRATLKRKTRETHLCEEDMACPVVLPPKIKWIDASHNQFHTADVTEMVLMRNNTLSFLNVSHSGMQTLRRPLYCAFNITPQIEVIDLSNNNLRCFVANFFNKTETRCNWHSLKFFYLKNNQLGNIEGNICNDDKNNVLGFLKPLNNLRVLDISNNKLMFNERLADIQGLTQLHELDLSSNGFSNFPLNLVNMTRLVKLNLANNNFQCLSKATIRRLDHHQKLNDFTTGFEIDLSGNQFSCRCDCIHFLQWLKRTSVSFVNIRSYQCVFPDGEMVNLNRLSYVITKLEPQCYGTQWFVISVAVLGVTYLVIFGFCLMYRLRCDIWFFYMKIKLKRQKLRTLLNQHKYNFSAFVSCEHRDAKYFVKRRLLPILETDETKLKFCVAQRDFIVGATIIDNIIRAMNRSRKIIFVISEYFLMSNWCKEEIRIAQQVRNLTLSSNIEKNCETF